MIAEILTQATQSTTKWKEKAQCSNQAMIDMNGTTTKMKVSSWTRVQSKSGIAIQSTITSKMKSYWWEHQAVRCWQWLAAQGCNPPKNRWEKPIEPTTMKNLKEATQTPMLTSFGARDTIYFRNLIKGSLLMRNPGARWLLKLWQSTLLRKYDVRLF